MPRKAPQSLAHAPWYTQAVDIMVRANCSLKMAATELGVEVDVFECDRIAKSKPFQEALAIAKNRYFTEVANTPGRSKQVLIGMALAAVEKLMLEGEWDKAIVGIEKIAKLEGWLGGEGNINVFAGVTPKDIADAKERILKQIADSTGPSSSPTDAN